MPLKTTSLFFGILFPILLIFYFPYLNFNSPLTLNFLAVGNGDSIVITDKNIPLFVIDGGPDYSIDYFLSRYFPFLNCQIDYVFLTHPHSDHLRGLNRILEHCDISNIYENKIIYESNIYETWLDILDKKHSEPNGLEVNSFKSGSIVTIGELNIISLYPSFINDASAALKLKSANDISLVLLIDYGQFEALLMGDIEAKNQQYIDLELLNKYLDGPLEILKVPHHGAYNAYNKAFYDSLPKIEKAVVSTGPNKYGHPSPIVLDDLVNRGVDLIRTDKAGDIRIRMIGK